MQTKKESVRLAIIEITIDSIRANAVSLLGQLRDYDFLTVSEEQMRELEQIEAQLHKLVKEITRSA